MPKHEYIECAVITFVTYKRGAERTSYVRGSSSAIIF